MNVSPEPTNKNNILFINGIDKIQITTEITGNINNNMSKPNVFTRKNSPNSHIAKIKLHEIISKFTVIKTTAFKNYLNEIFHDLSVKFLSKKGFTKHAFASYFRVPGIILDRLFNAFNKQKLTYLIKQDFINGMLDLFSNDFNITSKFIFDFYDFNNKGKISREEIRIVLSYVNLTKREGCYYGNTQAFNDRIKSQEELNRMLNSIFCSNGSSSIRGNKYINYKQFINVIDNVSSDVYLLILLFLYENKPFNNEIIEIYEKELLNEENNLKSNTDAQDITNIDNNDNIHNEKDKTTVIAMPNTNIIFSPYKMFQKPPRKNTFNNEGMSSLKEVLFHENKPNSITSGDIRENESTILLEISENKDKYKTNISSSTVKIDIIKETETDDGTLINYGETWNKLIPIRRKKENLAKFRKEYFNEEEGNVYKGNKWKSSKFFNHEGISQDNNNNVLILAYENLNLGVSSFQSSSITSINNSKIMSKHDFMSKNDSTLIGWTNNNNNSSPENSIDENEENNLNDYSKFSDFNDNEYSQLQSIPIQVEETQDYDKETSHFDSKKSTSILSFTPLEHKAIIHKAFLFKKIHSQFKKYYYTLIGHDLLFYEKSTDKHHSGLHNLSGVFLKEEEPFTEIIEGNENTYYSFSLTFPNKKRMYYINSHNEHKKWMSKLKKVTLYNNINTLYSLGPQLGEGKFGLIKLGMNKMNGKNAAIKILTKSSMNLTEKEFVRSEIEIMKICQHPNIIHLYNVIETIDTFYIAMEYCEGGDLYSYLEKRNFVLPEQRACELIHKLCTAIYYIHSYGIVHRDLKPENILMTSEEDDADIRILDFGLSKILGPDDKCTEPFGTICYVAPELLMEKPYSKSIDIWAIGVITYLMLCGQLPFDHVNDDKEIVRQTLKEKPNLTFGLWKTISDEGKDFVNKLLEKNVNKRPTIEKALEHKWFSKFLSKELVEGRIKEEDEVKRFRKYSMSH